MVEARERRDREIEEPKPTFRSTAGIDDGTPMRTTPTRTS